MKNKTNEVDFSIRVNEKLKTECVEFCNHNNITLTDFIKAFIEKTAQKGEFPFSIHDVNVSESNNCGNDKYNPEPVSKIHIRFNDKEKMEQFKDVCEKFFLSYSVAIKAYMRICLERDKVICPKRLNSKLYNSRDYMKFEKNKQARELREKIKKG